MLHPNPINVSESPESPREVAGKVRRRILRFAALLLLYAQIDKRNIACAALAV